MSHTHPLLSALMLSLVMWGMVIALVMVGAARAQVDVDTYNRSLEQEAQRNENQRQQLEVDKQIRQIQRQNCQRGLRHFDIDNC